MNELLTLYARVFFPLDNPTFGNPPFDDATCRVLIVRLSPFRDVDRSLPHLFLFHHVRQSLPRAFIDMAFFPSAAQRRLFEESGTPYLLGIQSRRPANDFDLLLISNAYTLELINLPYLLFRSDIPLFAGERGPRHPILILGGSNAMAAQCIVREDRESMVDAIFFGEGEEWVGELTKALAHTARDERRKLLPTLATKIEGLWVSGSTTEVRQAIVRAPRACHLPTTYPLLNGPEAHVASLQVTYGCPAFCSFCFEGYDRKPYRELPLVELLAVARHLKTTQGNDTLNIYSFNFNTHRDVFALLHEMHRLFERVNVKSQRADVLYRTPYLLEAQLEADKRTFTLGIEGISERQRAWLHKSLSTADILGLLSRLFTLKIREVKLFYLLTGHETEQEIVEFRHFVKAIRRERKRGIRVIFSFGPLIRMPRTPLQYDRLFLDPRHWRPLIGQVKSACETNGFEFRLAFDLPTYFTTQVLALGGHWLTGPVAELAREGHFFDTALPTAYWEKLRHRLVATGHLNADFVREKGPTYPFPFSFVRTAIPPSFLYRQYRLAQEGRDEGYCLGNKCLGCGACADDAQRQQLTGHAIHIPAPERYLSHLHQVVTGKRRLPIIYALMRLSPSVSGTYPEFLNAYVMRTLLRLHPALADNLLAVRESLFTRRPLSDRFPSLGGETVLALKGWDADALEQALGSLATAATPDVQVLRVLHTPADFTPGTFSQARLHLHLPASAFANPRYHLEQHLRASYLPYLLHRQGTRHQIRVPPKGRKKKSLFGGWFTLNEHGIDAELEIGPRFDLLGLLRRFDIPAPEAKATIAISHLRCSPTPAPA